MLAALRGTMKKFRAVAVVVSVALSRRLGPE